MRCSVFGCNNSNQGASATTSILYHSFPKDSTVRRQWLNLCGRNVKVNPNTARICSIHFVNDDYPLDPFLVPYGIKNKRKKLKIGAIPTQHLPQKQPKGENSMHLDRLTRRNENKTKNEFDSLKSSLMNIRETNNDFVIYQSPSTSSIENQRFKNQRKLIAVPVDIQEQETSELPCDIKQEITIDESVLEDCIYFPKLETFENSSAGTSCEQNPLLEVENQTSPKTDNISSSTSSKSFTKRRKVIKNQIGVEEDSIGFLKLETFENSSAGTSCEQNPLLEVENQTSQETDNISSSTLSKSFTKRRKVIENDIGVEEDQDFPDTVQVKLENEDDHVDYGMYIASRLQNANQSDRAIAMAKQKIELILSDLEMGIFEMSLH